MVREVDGSTHDAQTRKLGAAQQTDQDDTRLPSGQCTPEAPPRSLPHAIADTMAAFGAEQVDLSVAAKAACRLSAANAKAKPRFRGKSWAEMSEDDTLEPEPQPASWSQAVTRQAGPSSDMRPSSSSTPGVRSWASTPDRSPRAHGSCAALADRHQRDEGSPASASTPAGAVRSNPGSSDAAVFALIRGLREAAMLD
jgi:hypothetical protein